MTYASTARPDESVVSLSEMLGTYGVAVSSRVGRAPNARTGLTAGALLLREGYQGLSIGIADGPRHYRPDAIVRVREPEEVAASVEPGESPARSGARLRLATATGAVVALGSLVGASMTNNGSSPSPVSATVRELGNVYAGYGVLSGPSDPSASARSASRSAAGSLAPLRGSDAEEHSGVPGLTARWARPEPVSDVRPDGHSHRTKSIGSPDRTQVLAAPDARQSASRSHDSTAPDASRRDDSGKKWWPLRKSNSDDRTDAAAHASGTESGKSGRLDKSARSDEKSGSDKAARLGKSTKSGKSATTDRAKKSSTSDRSSSKRRSSSDSGDSKRSSSSDSGSKHSSSSGKSSSHHSSSHGGGHSSGKGGGGHSY